MEQQRRGLGENSHRSPDRTSEGAATIYELFFEYCNDAVYVHHVGEDGVGTFIEVNRRACELLGYSRDEFLRMKPTDIDAPDSREHEKMVVAELFSQGHAVFETVHRSRDGARIPVEVNAVLFELEGHSAVMSIARDITKRKRAEEALRDMLIVDDLTGLYNRRGFLTVGGEALHAARRLEKAVLVVFVDLDDLKVINDTYGHLEGDRALVATARIMKSTFRDADVLCRFGGDEFVALVMETGRDAEVRIAERAEEALRAHNERAGKSYRLGLSIGIAKLGPLEDVSLEHLVHLADARMYENKRRQGATAAVTGTTEGPARAGPSVVP